MSRKPAPPPPPPIRTYGFKGDVAQVQEKLGVHAQLFFDQRAFANHKYAIDHGAPPREDLFWQIGNVLLPGYFIRDPWSERIARALCNNCFVGLSGCGSSSKTHNVTGFAVLWWLCDPLNSSVLICSTTVKSLRKRNWANIQRLHALIPGVAFGNFVDSRMQWQSKRGDDMNAISGIAVEEGDTKAAADKIKGTHTKRQLVIVNEANSVNLGIWEACANLYSYPMQVGGEFILAAEANPSSWLDAFGQFTEPIGGVNSVTVDTEEWETVGPKPFIPQLSDLHGICIRFDVEKTPNLDYPADKPINKHLPSRERAERCMHSPLKDSPTYWSNERGFPPPEGLNKNVFSEPMLHNADAFATHKFTGNNFQIIGAFDYARTGDKPTLRFGAMGEIENGAMGLEWMKPIVIKVNVGSNNPVAYQILEQLRRECENVQYRNTKTYCPPQNLGIDDGGGGADFCDMVQRGWSPLIMRVDFGAAASEDPCSYEDVRPSNTVYRNKRAEMYHRTRNGIISGQIKGVDQETAKEMVTIEYDDSKKLTVIVSKEEYRKVYRKSPDDTDSAVILTEVARRKGFKLAAVGETVKRVKQSVKVYEEAQSRFNEVSYSRDNEDLGITFEFAGDYDD